MKEPHISFEELMKEVEEVRKKYTYGIKSLTKDQLQFLEVCRGKVPPVPYREMKRLWEKVGWGKTSDATMRRHYYKAILKQDVR